ncbi:MAG: protein translocase subunit SecF [Dehalococcoidia bacterium]|jgi:preprotein translocase subunit SecF|nr:protein translocase subunit SecF [Dehalococcoidia bacterium]
MIDFVGKRHWAFLGSVVAVAVAVFALAAFGLRPGIDFAGGTSMTLRFEPQVEQGDLRQAVAAFGSTDAVIQRSGDDYLLRMKLLSVDQRESLLSTLSDELKSQLTVLDYNTVSPSIATETARQAGLALLFASIAMLLYIAWSFRKMPSPLKWGTCAIVALVHNIVIVAGLFALLGKARGVEVDALFITGLLTIVGYTINNTVVVFDRVRENRAKGISTDLAVTVNCSLVETLVRTVNTSLTTLCVILALLLFGGSTIYYFILVLFVGLLVGTYSSMFIAGPLLVTWEKREWGLVLDRIMNARRANSQA